MENWEEFKVGKIEEGKSGSWSLVEFEVSKEDAQMMELRAMFNPQRRDRSVPAGEYMGLYRDGSIIMSDTRAEIFELEPLFNQVKKGDRAIVFGLGLGVVVNGLFKLGAKEVHVVELSNDVMNLTADHWKSKFGDKLTIEKGDACEFDPIEGFDVVWYDIWDDISSRYIDQMEEFRQQWKGLSRWTGSWAEDQAIEQRDRVESGFGLY
jgi:hypothetical protein